MARPTAFETLLAASNAAWQFCPAGCNIFTVKSNHTLMTADNVAIALSTYNFITLYLFT